LVCPIPDNSEAVFRKYPDGANAGHDSSGAVSERMLSKAPRLQDDFDSRCGRQARGNGKGVLDAGRGNIRSVANLVSRAAS